MLIYYQEGLKCWPFNLCKLLDSSAADPFRAELESEFNTLTKIGNNFTIRHHEHGKHALPNDHARDYLFIRLVGLIAFVLRQTGRMGPKESASVFQGDLKS
jgi:hypothetical protein